MPPRKNDNTDNLVTQAKERNSEPFMLTVDDREIKITRPKEASFVFLQLAMDSDSNTEAAREMMAFVDDCLSPADQKWIARRLRDQSDDYDFDDVTALFNRIIKGMTGNPTESPSD